MVLNRLYKKIALGSKYLIFYFVSMRETLKGFEQQSAQKNRLLLESLLHMEYLQIN